MRILGVIIIVSLTGCGTYGEPLILSSFYDRQDPCQLKNNQGRYPSWCGASSGREYLYSPQGRELGYWKK